MHVVVSGAAGHLGRVLLPRLCAMAGVDRVTGIDLCAGGFASDKYRECRADAASPRAMEVLSGADAVIHLAFVLLRGRRSAAAMARGNVATTRSFLGAAADAGVGRLIFMSSAAVYGGGENLAEGAPLAPLPGFLYAEQKRDCEAWIAAQLAPTVVLRPHIILGPNALPLLRRLAAAPVQPRLPPPLPRLQCVHEDDVAAAVLSALRCEAAQGPFNLAAPCSFSLQEMAGHRRRRALRLPLPLLRLGLHAAWRLTGWGGEPAWLEGTVRSLTLDCSRARDVLGWQPRHADWRAIMDATLAR